MILTDAQRLDWLRLIRSESVGPRTFRALVNRFGGAAGALEALPDLTRRAGRLLVRIPTVAEAEAEMWAAARLGVRLVALGEPDYPAVLQAIDTAPPLIGLRGRAEAAGRPAVAVVGSRNASAAGLTFTERLCRQIGEGGYVVVSGLARGIDTRAHRAALATGTVAVLAGGHDRVYPAANEPLLASILDGGGAVCSEMPMGWEPRGRDFPRRNRLVSGLAYGVVVVEAARRSGSLITARFAAEQGRLVFAVPGSPLDPRAEGTNDLLRSGASLCTGIDDILTALDPLVARGPPPPSLMEAPDAGAEPLWDELDLAEVAPAPAHAMPSDDEGVAGQGDPVMALLGPSPVGIDDLVRQSGRPIREVQLRLVELEIAGRLERHGGNAVSLLPQRP